ncbi:signal peptidase I [Microbacterium hydrocarbonoxydans]|uniref:signal peptidase I n=1 Tax=Microbacterium hydrocarbonoxydans TaxID=273678 RepID=UPI0020419CE8|nr:signal peptidase I [Microbacterium hydrocarbonoxydans]MCM3779965.1 signal peptidase I [Microbacterium hydrocarbonoxydans]
MSTPATRRERRERSADRIAEGSGEAPTARESRSAGRFLVDSALWIAAAAGVVCIALVVLALAAQVTLIMFRTGSMSPTIPAGSVAVVQRVPATDVAVGDIVTVDRSAELPITHRITSVSDGATADERVITMRGDANTSDDPFPYAVTSVRRVLFSVPGVAPVIVALGDPLVLGGITVAATVIVVWAFWPRRRHEAGGA